MRALLAAALLLFASPALADEGQAPGAFPCAGRWTGVGHNTGFERGWTIDMTVHTPDAEGSCGTIEYTTPSCGGTIRDCRVVGGQVLVQERYSHSDGCAPPARLEFRCEGDRMQWAWLGWETARTTLARVGPAPSNGASTPSPTPVNPPESQEQPPVDTPDVMPSTGCRCGVTRPQTRTHAEAGLLLLLGLVSRGIRRRLA